MVGCTVEQQLFGCEEKTAAHKGDGAGAEHAASGLCEFDGVVSLKAQEERSRGTAQVARW